jgi:predicted porin
VPATGADLLAMRARGWRTTYPVGSPEAAPGVPLISAFRWDTGVQAHWEGSVVDLTGGVTVGTLSDPRVSDRNDGKQLSGRIGVRPMAGLILGASGAHGEFIGDNVNQLVPDSQGSHAQTAFGADAEYSRGHWLVRGELVWSRWNVPFAASPPARDLDALGMWVEGRYRVTPRIVLAARMDHLGFSRFEVLPGLQPTWDAPVTRFETDASYYLQRNLVARLAVQYNDREGGRVRTRTYFSGQIAYWF